MVTVIIPYALDKDLGRAYNEAMATIPNNGWACILDYDVQFLTPDAIAIVHEYTKRFPRAGMLTCWTNRIHPLSTQLFNGQVNPDPDITKHIRIAQERKKHLYAVTELPGQVSGFLMVIKKSTWLRCNFKEGIGCLGVDTHYWRLLKKRGLSILRMEGLYVWHNYRIMTGISDKTHLK